jgi:hypothetical protein
MKYGIFGDVHGNLEALEAVLADMEDQEVTHPLCIGDLVGYNANPSECLEVVRALGCPVVRGNHDELVTYRQNPPAFSKDAQALVTRQSRANKVKSALEYGMAAKGLFDMGRGIYQGVSTYGPAIYNGARAIGPAAAAVAALL